MSKEQLAKDLAEEIFDMIDRNYPLGLIKSDLADLIGKHMAAWETPPAPNHGSDGVTFDETGRIVHVWTSNKPDIVRFVPDGAGGFVKTCPTGGGMCGND